MDSDTNGKMNNKLLYKTSKTYLLYSVLILLISAPVFYYSIKRLYIQEADDTLLLHKKEFSQYYLPTLKITDISVWNNFNRNIKIKTFFPVTKDSIFFTHYYDTLEDENEPYRELNTNIMIQGEPYIYMARLNLVETEDLMQSVVVLFLIIIIILLTGLLIITKKLSGKLWKPFYETLKQVENFEVDKSNKLVFEKTEIEEFSRLNKSIEKLAEKNTLIYKTQREFVENAAHELQTPLAVFQAKIDSLMQRTDISEEQFKILNSLNENVSRLNRLNKNLLLLSKIENDSYSKKETVLLNNLIKKNLDFFIEQATAKNITIELILTKDPAANSNPVLAEILISNLFLNAIRHNIAGGKIIVLTDDTSVSFLNNGSIQALNKEKLFLRFYKANPSDDGTGLGLSIIKKIADHNNWKFSYQYSEKLHSFSLTF